MLKKFKGTWIKNQVACLAFHPCTLALHRKTPICGMKAQAPARAIKKFSYTKWGFSSRCFGRRFSFSCNKTPLIEFFWTQHGQKMLRLQCLQILGGFSASFVSTYNCTTYNVLTMSRWRYVKRFFGIVRHNTWKPYIHFIFPSYI